MDRGAWWATVQGVTKVGHNRVTNTHESVVICYRSLRKRIQLLLLFFTCPLFFFFGLPSRRPMSRSLSLMISHRNIPVSGVAFMHLIHFLLLFMDGDPLDSLEVTLKGLAAKATTDKRGYIKLKAAARQKKRWSEEPIYGVGEDSCKTKCSKWG